MVVLHQSTFPPLGKWAMDPPIFSVVFFFPRVMIFWGGGVCPRMIWRVYEPKRENGCVLVLGRCLHDEALTRKIGVTQGRPSQKN